MGQHAGRLGKLDHSQNLWHWSASKGVRFTGLDLLLDLLLVQLLLLRHLLLSKHVVLQDTLGSRLVLLLLLGQHVWWHPFHFLGHAGSVE